MEARHTTIGILTVVVMLAGCAGSDQAGENERSAGPRASALTPSYVEMDLAAAENSVRSIQIYREGGQQGGEHQLPIIALKSSQQLMLEFDIMVEDGRPLSVYFYHADRIWRRDLSASQFLESYQHDNVLDYQMSAGTQVPYVHYSYRFPNDNIEFLISGNYIVRVTEQGDEENVLFERAFFVTEQATALDFVTDRVLVGDYGYPFIQPIAEFRPAPGTEGDVFDYNVCFARNGRFDLARCSDRPSLMNAPSMQFFLEPETSFEPEAAPYFLDLSNLRSSNQIVSADFSTSPYQIELEPDHAAFGGSGFARPLSGQSIISSVVPVGEPDVRGEYVLVRFAFVPPDEQRLGGEVLVTGSFNGWRYDAVNRLEWVAERARYEGEILLKQGQYEYRYVSRDRRALQRSMPQSESQLLAFVYYDDPSLQTDRLLAVKQTLVQ